MSTMTWDLTGALGRAEQEPCGHDPADVVEPAVRPLRAAEVTALRAASSLVFRFDGSRHSIVPVREAGGTLKFGREVSVDGSCRSHRVEDLPGAGAPVETAVVSVTDVPLREEAQTWLKILRPEDTISLEWVASRNNGYLTDAGLVHDELWLTVVRERGGRVTRWRFFVVDCICPPHSSARMCQLAQ